MLKAIAAALLIATLPATAETYDPCVTVSRMMGEVVRERDSGARMVDLLRAGVFASDDEKEQYLSLLALAYGHPEWSAGVLQEAMLDACYAGG